VKSLAVAVVLAAGSAHAQPQPGWEIRVPERVEVAVGASTLVPITIAVDRGLVVSRDAPVIVDLAPPQGVTIKKRRLGRPDAVDPEADAPRFAATVRGDAAGSAVVKIRVRLWLCGGKVCKPLDVHRQTTVVVATP
jgi:hypothetical protein